MGGECVRRFLRHPEKRAHKRQGVATISNGAASTRRVPNPATTPTICKKINVGLMREAEKTQLRLLPHNNLLGHDATTTRHDCDQACSCTVPCRSAAAGYRAAITFEFFLFCHYFMYWSAYVEWLETDPTERVVAALTRHLCAAVITFNRHVTRRTAFDWSVYIGRERNTGA